MYFSKHSLRLKLSPRSIQTPSDCKVTLKSVLVVTLEPRPTLGPSGLRGRAVREHRASTEHHLVPGVAGASDVKKEKPTRPH